MAEFAVAGFPGCVGSADCTHITMEKCDKHLKNHHTGPKSSHTTRSFSLTANHRRGILHTCTGGPGRWNDQTMVLYDSFIKGMHEGVRWQWCDFVWWEDDDEWMCLGGSKGAIKKQKKSVSGLGLRKDRKAQT